MICQQHLLSLMLGTVYGGTVQRGHEGSALKWRRPELGWTIQHSEEDK